MRLVHVVPSIAAEASGPSYSVPQLCESLAQLGADVSLHVRNPVPPGERSFEVVGYPYWALASRLTISPRMRAGLRAAAQGSDILHNHSLWMLPNIYPGAVVRGTGCRLVVSPRGTLSPVAMARSPWLKRLVWGLGQRSVLERSACLHATAEHEYADIRRMGLRAPVAILPNGVHLTPETASEDGRAGASRRLLYLGRLHPIKGLDHLLRAWRAVQAACDDWELRLVGPEEPGYGDYLRGLAAEIGCERVTFVGAAYGAAKSQAYREGSLYVLPTHSENFGMTVAEALAHGLPAIVTQGAPWPGLVKEGCGWWIGVGEGPLTECLREALARTPEELAGMGRRGREWMVRDFSWQGIGRRMLATYEWLLGGGAAPEWVRTD